MDRLKLLQLWDTHFDQDELYELCFTLSLDEENLPGKKILDQLKALE